MNGSRPVAIEPRHAGTAPADRLPARAVVRATGLAEIEQDWLEIRSRCGLETPWTHPERFLAELRVLPPDIQPRVVIFGEPGTPRGAIIARISRSRLRCPLGYWHVHSPRLRVLKVVHGGLITDGSPQAEQNILDTLAEYLHTGEVDAISVNHLPVDDPLCAPLVERGGVQQMQEPHWRLRMVPGSYDQTIAAFSSKQRSEMRRRERALDKHCPGGVTLRCFAAPDEVDDLIGGAAAIAERTYQHGLGTGFRDEQPWRSILEHEARAGRLRAYWLECNGEPVAFQIGSIYNDVYFGDFIGYHPDYASRAAGIVLHAHVLRDLCNRNVRGFDYGFGHADYKRNYGTDCRDEALLMLYGSTWRARGAAALIGSTGWLNRHARNGVDRLGVRHTLKRVWRSRLRS